jgi:hypothetical protein
MQAIDRSCPDNRYRSATRNLPKHQTTLLCLIRVLIILPFTEPRTAAPGFASPNLSRSDMVAKTGYSLLTSDQENNARCSLRETEHNWTVRQRWAAVQGLLSLALANCEVGHATDSALTNRMRSARPCGRFVSEGTPSAPYDPALSRHKPLLSGLWPSDRQIG